MTAAAVLYISVFTFGVAFQARSGEKPITNRSLSVDKGNCANGYIYACSEQTSKKLKLRITHDDETLTYDIQGDGEWEAFPLQLGSGGYIVTLYEQVSGQKYKQAGRVTVDAELTEEEIAFLYPNQYVSYTEGSEVVKLGREISRGCSTETARFEVVCRYVEENLQFDYVKLVTVPGGTLPDIDGCLSTGRGICQDLAAVATAMLRCAGVHTKLVIGYADGNYHAWVAAEVDGRERIYDPTVALGALGAVKEYTAERYY